MLLRVTNPPLYVAAGIVGNLTAKVLIHFFTEQAASWSGSSPIYCGGHLWACFLSSVNHQHLQSLWESFDLTHLKGRMLL